MTVQNLPAINATLNAIATLFLLAGWIAIKKKNNPTLHRHFMVAALACSAAFLTCYLYYHYFARITPYEGEGIMRYLYYTILITHVPLAGLMVPFILAAVYFAYRKQFDQHTKITKFLWPVWIYVSVTGVLIYLMLYQF